MLHTRAIHGYPWNSSLKKFFLLENYFLMITASFEKPVSFRRNFLQKLLKTSFILRQYENKARLFLENMGVFHLPKNSGNSGWVVNGTWFFGSFHWKISGKKRNSWKGSPVFPVETSQWKFVFHLQISRLYHQFHVFRRLSSGQASLVFQQKWRLIRVSFLEAFCKQTFRVTTSALPATL